MKQSLVKVITSDKLPLEGLLSEPDSVSQKIVLQIHGRSGNFYQNKFLASMAEAYTRSGWSFLSVNTRGHDQISEVKLEGSNEFKLIGNFNEKFVDCMLDIKGWVDFLSTEGYQEIVLQGHSLGANKVVYYLVNAKDPRVKKLILASPPDMIALAKRADTYPQLLELARELVEKGKGDNLLPEKHDDWYYLTANNFLDFGVEGNPIDIFNISNKEGSSILEEVKVPVLSFLGDKDEIAVNSATDDLEILKNKSGNNPSFKIEVIKDADHGYTGQEEVIARLVVDWLNT